MIWKPISCGSMKDGACDACKRKPAPDDFGWVSYGGHPPYFCCECTEKAGLLMEEKETPRVEQAKKQTRQ